MPIPVAGRERFGPAALEMALSGGEDYQLLFTAPPELMSEVSRGLEYPVTVIGEIISRTDETVTVIDETGG